MSTKSKLLALTEDLQLKRPTEPVPPQAEALTVPPAASPSTSVGTGIKFPSVAAGPVPRTAPGQMLQIRTQILAAEGEAGKLREQLKQFDGAAATRKLDPSKIAPSRWANRHAAAFQRPEFTRLKQDIETAGGNTQPIAVRPLAGAADRFEIIFGHRRHQACLELGLPVLAMIETLAVSDTDLFSAMDRENRERADLSPYEQGTMYRRALDDKLYPSNRRLAEALGVSHTWVANVLQVADLPAPLVECFRSPLEIQPKVAKQLTVAYESDRKGMLRRAERFRQQGRSSAPSVVLDALLGASKSEVSAGDTGLLTRGGRKFGSWQKDKMGRLIITIESGVVDPAAAEALLGELTERLASAPIHP